MVCCDDIVWLPSKLLIESGHVCEEDACAARGGGGVSTDILHIFLSYLSLCSGVAAMVSCFWGCCQRLGWLLQP